RIRVMDLISYWKMDGLGPEQLADDFSWVPRAAIYAAFAYYFDHIQEIEDSYVEDAAYAKTMLLEHPTRIHVFQG
ncbi:MAG: hypothetical protein ACKVT1_15100, partial [Dehalococcoidia bacterium]